MLRRHPSGLLTAFVALLTAALVSPAGTARTEGRPPVASIGALETIEPGFSRDGVVLLTGIGEARLTWQDGRRRRLPVGPRERLTEIVDLGRSVLTSGVETSDRAVAVDLVLLRADPDRVVRLPVPAGTGDRLRIRPKLLTYNGDLAGMSWLEGNAFDRLSVYAAEWLVDKWGPPVLVAAPHRGSQTGLAATTLSNGSYLLVWTRFDGTDDELVFSISSGSEFSEFSSPRRIGPGNSYPDIAPALISNGADSSGQAIVAWSQYDGHDYRLRTASFDGHGWKVAAWRGEPGSLYPTLKRTAGGRRRASSIYLLYRNARPRGWSVRALDLQHRVKGLALSLDPTPLRPVLRSPTADTPDTPEGITFEWPQRKGAQRRQFARWESTP